uniref:14-3-3 domain-containing protein n=1 Tax=Chromera velia CCMP2878 TaxID=1169474 RepID=A0A0G4HU15_9ALVE|eukprot:Cvel_31673.t1-p1 / transcript=Cvel_31673.t1 / gene=Cvel_31673 / organism=Chromera_velia_CCMP2878 / gene_product=14-3-3-like protein, putative / transcript_product=14-3-3-like protein, putative / location=Cvel_scaffold4763:1641-4797(+) / protein_length=341 / sequence_SO=supercontig / SO=protein_coding / is_pseudo=false
MTRTDFQPEERRLLGVGYTHALGKRRTMLAVLSKIEELRGIAFTEDERSRFEAYRTKIEQEIADRVGFVNKMIDGHLMPNAAAKSAAVFYFKMKGDLQRQQLETQTKRSQWNMTLAGLAKDYADGLELAVSELSPRDSLRCALVINFAVVLWQYFGDRVKAFRLMKKSFELAFQQALSDGIEYSTDPREKDVTVLLQSMRDHLYLWRPEVTDEDIRVAEEEELLRLEDEAEAEAAGESPNGRRGSVMSQSNRRGSVASIQTGKRGSMASRPSGLGLQGFMTTPMSPPIPFLTRKRQMDKEEEGEEEKKEAGEEGQPQSGEQPSLGTDLEGEVGRAQSISLG